MSESCTIEDIKAVSQRLKKGGTKAVVNAKRVLKESERIGYPPVRAVFGDDDPQYIALYWWRRGSNLLADIECYTDGAVMVTLADRSRTGNRGRDNPSNIYFCDGDFAGAVEDIRAFITGK